jgi:hypothetical protein
MVSTQHTVVSVRFEIVVLSPGPWPCPSTHDDSATSPSADRKPVAAPVAKD